MKKNRNGRFVVAMALVAGMAAAAAANSAMALSMSSSQSFTLDVSDSHASVATTSGMFSDEDSSTLSFAQFDTLGGTRVLTSVDVFVGASTPTLNAGVDGTCVSCNASAENHSTFSVAIDAPIGGPFDFTLTAPSPSDLTLMASANCDDPDCMLLDSESDNPALGSFDIVISTPSQLSAFMGGGNISVVPDLALSGPYSITNVGDNSTTVSASTEWLGSVKVTYNFSTPSTGVPEPASLALIGVALVAFGVSRTRRRSS